MAQTTLYLVQPFKRRGKRLVAGERVKASDEADAKRRAARMARVLNVVGTLAVSITGDADAQDFDEPVILARFGETPPEE